MEGLGIRVRLPPGSAFSRVGLETEERGWIGDRDGICGGASVISPPQQTKWEVT